VNNWVLNPRIEELTDSVVLVQESEVIKVAALRELWNTSGEVAVLGWFRNGTMRLSEDFAWYYLKNPPAIRLYIRGRSSNMNDAVGAIRSPD
jgi:hypothetical protein